MQTIKKLRIIYIISLSILILSLAHLSFCFEPIAKDQRIIIISLPKSGTHLLARCIELLTNKKPLYDINININPNEKNFAELSDAKHENLTTLADNNFLISHLRYTPENEKAIEIYNYKGLFIYRDPRDQIISYLYWIYKYPKVWPELAKLERNDLLKNLLSGLNDFYGNWIPWKHNKNIYSAKFEDLIGPNGGGNKEKQYSEIKKIALYLNLDASDSKIQSTIKNLFGNTFTFREGQIGSWKKEFTPQFKEQFKEKACQLLIDLGYEKDLNW